MIIESLETISNRELNIHFISHWLKENENYFNFLISESACRKWSKWKEDKNILIYPCVCQKRELDCIFLEAYHKLLKAEEMYNIEPFFRAVVLEYNQIKQCKRAIYHWVSKYQKLGNNSSFKSTIRIDLKSKSKKQLEIKLNDDEFRNVLKFQKCFYEEYYSEKYQKIIT